MDVTVSRKHAVFEEIECRSAADAHCFGKARSAGTGSRIVAHSADIGKTQDEISAGLVEHDRVIPAVLAEDAMGIRIQLLEGKHRKRCTMQAPGPRLAKVFRHCTASIPRAFIANARCEPDSTLLLGRT